MEKELALQPANSPANMMQMAIAGNIDLEKVEKMLELQKVWEANEAKKAFHLAMSEFKENPPVIIKDKKNSQYGSMYTTLGNLVNTVNPELSKQGLSHRWDIEQNGTIKVTCIMTHKQGHSESSSMSAAADSSGSKNAIQQIKSTITYLKSVTFESICGLASTNSNMDDDGKSSETEETIDENKLKIIRNLLTEAKADEAQFLKYLEVEKLEDLPKAGFLKAKVALEVRKKGIKQ